MFRTSDSHAPDQLAGGEWKLVEAPDEDATFLEIEEYCNFKRLFSVYGYHFFLVNRLSVRSYPDLTWERTTPSERCQDALNTLARMADWFPTVGQLMRHRWSTATQPAQDFYHTSYTTFSFHDRRSRSWILANLPALLEKMAEYKQVFTDALPTAANRDEHERLYDALLVSYEKWRAMAESQCHSTVPLSATRTREQAGRSGRRLRQLLARLGAPGGAGPPVLA